jgi:hypothetical protein
LAFPWKPFVLLYWQTYFDIHMKQFKYCYGIKKKLAVSLNQTYRYRLYPINQQSWFLQWTQNKGHHRIWHICFILTQIADWVNHIIWQTWWLHYMTNFMVLNLQSSTFLFYVVIYHCHLLMVCISPSWFDTQEHVLKTFETRPSTDRKLMLQVITNLA